MSIRPGRTVLPCKSITSVRALAQGASWSSPPIARILPLRTAMEAATVCVASIVTMWAFLTSRSTSEQVAPRAPAGSRNIPIPETTPTTLARVRRPLCFARVIFARHSRLPSDTAALSNCVSQSGLRVKSRELHRCTRWREGYLCVPLATREKFCIAAYCSSEGASGGANSERIIEIELPRSHVRISPANPDPRQLSELDTAEEETPSFGGRRSFLRRD